MQERAELSPLAKIIFGVMIAGVICLIFPILDLLEIFFTVCFIPFVFVMAMLGISEGTIEMIQERSVGRFMGDLRGRLDAWRMRFKEGKADDAVVVEPAAPVGDSRPDLM